MHKKVVFCFINSQLQTFIFPVIEVEEFFYSFASDMNVSKRKDKKNTE